MKKILLLSTGGTISCKQGEKGLVPQLTPKDILDFVPSAAEICTLTVKEVFSMDSSNFRPSCWLALAGEIRKNYENYDGFVILSGTDTLAYTAGALSYLIQNSYKPIVITGSQIPISEEKSDAPNNVEKALRYAVSDEGCLVSVVFNDKVISGTRARKGHTMALGAFESVNRGYKGAFDGEALQVFDTKGRPVGDVTFYESLAGEAIVLKVTPGLTGDCLRLLKDEYSIFVLEGYGVGNLPTDESMGWKDRIKELLSEGKIVVVAPQSPYGSTDMNRYETGRLFKDDSRLLEAFDMTTTAAVTKLMWISALVKTGDFEEIHRLFYLPVDDDIRRRI